MPPRLSDSYLPFKDTYRDRARYGGLIYLVHLSDGSTAKDADGEPLKFSHEEALDLARGRTFAAVIAERPGVYPAEAAPVRRKKVQ